MRENPRMLMPGQTYDAADRVKFTSSAGQASTLINNGFGVSSAGRIHGDTNAPGASAVFNGGFAFNTSGTLHVTASVTGTDLFVNGYRISLAGALVYAPEGTIVNYNGSQGFDSNGALVTTEL